MCSETETKQSFNGQRAAMTMTAIARPWALHEGRYPHRIHTIICVGICHDQPVWRSLTSGNEPLWHVIDGNGNESHVDIHDPMWRDFRFVPTEAKLVPGTWTWKIIPKSE